MLHWRILVCFFLGVCLTENSQGQTIISGVATYNQLNPLKGVSVSLDGTYEGATTNEKGFFQLEVFETGKHLIICHLMGYADVKLPIDIKKGVPVKLVIIFTMKTARIDEIVIKSVAFVSSDKNRVTAMKPLDILTTATDGNITSALKTLPGAQQVGESGDLFVRGGTGAETKTFIDGMMVNNFNYSSPSGVASRSRFPPGLFKGSFFSSGGYSALYGQALSSTLILDSEDLPLKSSADFTITPFWLGAGINKVNKKVTASIGGTLNYTNLTPVFSITKPNINFIKNPEYLDATVFARKKIGERGMLKFYGSIGANSVGITQNDNDYQGVEDKVLIKSKNIYTNLTYKQTFNGGWKINTGLSLSHNFDANTIKAFRTDSDIMVFDSIGEFKSNNYQARVVATKNIFSLTKIHFGGEYQYNVEKIVSDSTGDKQQLKDSYVAIFTETDTYLADNITFRLGIRYEHSSLINKKNFAPRASIGYTFKDASLLSASYGEFYQKPESNLLWEKQDLGYTRATHYILSYQKIDSYYTFRTELFFKKYNQLVKTTPTINNDGSGYAKGIELFWRDKKTFEGFDYWVTYSFLDTKRDHLNFPTLVQPNFAANHTASIVVKKFFTKQATNIGLTYTYASGRPYYNPNLPVSDFLSDRTIDFHNLGLSVAYLPKIKKTFSVLVLTVSNVLGNQQVYGYIYSRKDPTLRTTLTPINNPFVFLGLFINLGIDRSNDIINGRL